MTTIDDATLTLSLWDQHDLTLTLNGCVRDVLAAVVQAGWCPLEYPGAELGLNAPGVRTFALIPAMGLGVRGSLVVQEPDTDYAPDELTAWLDTLIERHRQFEDATIDALNTNPMDDEEMTADVR